MVRHSVSCDRSEETHFYRLKSLMHAQICVVFSIFTTFVVYRRRLMALAVNVFCLSWSFAETLPHCCRESCDRHSLYNYLHPCCPHISSDATFWITVYLVLLKVERAPWVELRMLADGIWTWNFILSLVSLTFQTGCSVWRHYCCCHKIFETWLPAGS